MTSDDPKPDGIALSNVIPPALLTVDGETAFVLGRPGACAAENFDDFHPALSRVDFVGGAWVLQWTAVLPATGRDFAMTATSDGVVVGGSGQLDGQPTRGGTEAWVVRMRGDGTMAWSRRFATLFDEGVTAVLSRPSDKIVVAGWTAGAVAATPSSGSEDVFVAQFSNDGTLEWTRQFGTGANERPQRLLALDGTNFAITGWTRGQLEPGVTLVDFAFFLSKFDDTGTSAWTRQYAFSDVTSVARWGAGFVVADTTRLSLTARIAADGSLDWSHTATPDSNSGLGEVIALDDDSAALHALRTLPIFGPGVYPQRELVEQVLFADGGVSDTPGLGGGWPRQGNMLWNSAIAHRPDGKWIVAGAGTTQVKNLFALSAFERSGGTRFANFDWRFDGPTYSTNVSEFGGETVSALDLKTTNSNAAVVLTKVAIDGCAQGNGFVGLLRVQP